MKEIPILFNAPMVRAILEGRKTQTRRIIPEQPNIDPQTGDWLWAYGKPYESVVPIERYVESRLLSCKYGKPGDRLWVRETYRKNELKTGWPYEYRATEEQDLTPTDGPWKPSIFMPRDASRITLEVKNVRVERLHDISKADAIAEGIERFRPVPGDGDPTTKYKDASGKWISDPIQAYKTLWESINGPGSWDENPWVWVVKF